VRLSCICWRLAQLNRVQRRSVDYGDTILVAAALGLIAAVVAGPVGAVGGALYAVGAAVYNRKSEADHRRRQNMFDEIEEKVHSLIERIRP